MIQFLCSIHMTVIQFWCCSHMTVIQLWCCIHMTMIQCSRAGVDEVDGDVCGSGLDVLVPAVLHLPAAGQRHLHALPVHRRGGQEVGAGVQRPLPSLRLPAAVFCLHHHLLLLCQHPRQQRSLSVLLYGEEGSCGNPMGLSSLGGGMVGNGSGYEKHTGEGGEKSVVACGHHFTRMLHF